MLRRDLKGTTDFLDGGVQEERPVAGVVRSLLLDDSWFSCFRCWGRVSISFKNKDLVEL